MKPLIKSVKKFKNSAKASRAMHLQYTYLHSPKPLQGQRGHLIWCGRQIFHHACFNSMHAVTNHVRDGTHPPLHPLPTTTTKQRVLSMFMCQNVNRSESQQARLGVEEGVKRLIFHLSLNEAFWWIFFQWNEPQWYLSECPSWGRALLLHRPAVQVGGKHGKFSKVHLSLSNLFGFLQEVQQAKIGVTVLWY